MVDVGGAGSTWKGVSADPDEPFKLELENTELDARIAALNAGYDADDIRDASLEQVKAMTKRAAAAALEDGGVEADHEGAEAAAAVAAAKTRRASKSFERRSEARGETVDGRERPRPRVVRGTSQGKSGGRHCDACACA